MTYRKLNQNGFTTLMVLLVLVVVGGVGVTAWKLTAGDTEQKSNIADESADASQLSELDEATLTQAKELKKVDFDLDGTVNSVDDDDDNDGDNDDIDDDDDNDGILDDEDDDNDDDGVNDDDDDESQQQAELQEADEDSSTSDED